MEFQNPAPEAGRLLKTAQILDRSKHVCVWALPRRLQETTARQHQPSAGAVGGSGRGGGRVRQRQVGIPALGASATAPRGSHPRRCPSSPPQWSPAQMKIRFRARVLALRILSNVNLLCTFKPTFSAVVSGIVFARTSEID